MLNAQDESLYLQRDVIFAIRFLLNHRECSDALRSSSTAVEPSVTANISITGSFILLQDYRTFSKTSKNCCIKKYLTHIGLLNLKSKFVNGSKFYGELIFWCGNEEVIYKEIKLVFCAGLIKQPKHRDKDEYAAGGATDVPFIAVRSLKKTFILSETYNPEDVIEVRAIDASNKSPWADTVTLSDDINPEETTQTTQMAINQDVDILQGNTTRVDDSCLTTSSTCQLTTRIDKAGEWFQRNDKLNINCRLHVKKTNYACDKRRLKPVISVSSTEVYKQYHHSKNIMQNITCKKSTSSDSFFYCQKDSRNKANTSSTLKITIENLSDTINSMTFNEQMYSKILGKAYAPNNDKGDFNFQLRKKGIMKEKRHYIDVLMSPGQYLSSGTQNNMPISVYGVWGNKSASPLQRRRGNVVTVKPNDDQDMGPIPAKKQTNRFRPITDHDQKDNPCRVKMLPDKPIRANDDRLKKQDVLPTFDSIVDIINKAENERNTENSQASVGFRPLSQSDVEIALENLNPKYDVIPLFVNQTRRTTNEQHSVKNIDATQQETDNHAGIEHTADFNSPFQRKEYSCKDEDTSVESEREPVIDKLGHNYLSCGSFVPVERSTQSRRHLAPLYPYSDTSISKKKNQNNSTETNETGKHGHEENSNHKPSDLLANDQKSGANSDNVTRDNKVLFAHAIKDSHNNKINEKTSKRVESLLKFDVLKPTGNELKYRHTNQPRGLAVARKVHQAAREATLRNLKHQKLKAIKYQQQESSKYKIHFTKSKGFIPLLENELGSNYNPVIATCNIDTTDDTTDDTTEEPESSTATVQQIESLPSTKLLTLSKEISNMGCNLTKPDQDEIHDIEKLPTSKTECTTRQFATQDKTINSKVDHVVNNRDVMKPIKRQEQCLEDKNKTVMKTGNPESKPPEKSEHLKRDTRFNKFGVLQKNADVCLTEPEYLKLRQPVVKEPRIKHTGMRPAVIWEKDKDLTLDQLCFLGEKPKNPFTQQAYPKLQEAVQTPRATKLGQAESSNIHSKKCEKQTSPKNGDSKHKVLEPEDRPRYKIHQCSLYTTKPKSTEIQKKTKRTPVLKTNIQSNTGIVKTSTGRSVKTIKQTKVIPHGHDIPKIKKPEANDKGKDQKHIAVKLHNSSELIGGNHRYKKHQCVFPSSNETFNKVKTSKQPVKPAVNDEGKDQKQITENLSYSSLVIGGNSRFKKHRCVFPSSNETVNKVRTSKQPVNAIQARVVRNKTDQKQTKETQPKEVVGEQFCRKQIAFSNQVNIATDNKNNLDSRLCSDSCMNEAKLQPKPHCPVEETCKESDKSSDKDPIPCPAKLLGASVEDRFHCQDQLGPVDCASESLTSLERFKDVGDDSGEKRFGSVDQLETECGEMCEDDPAYHIETKPSHAETDVKLNICPDGGGTSANIDVFKDECLPVSPKWSLDLLNDEKIQNQLGPSSEENREQINSEMVGKSELLCNRLELETKDTLAPGDHLSTTNCIIRNQDETSILSEVEILDDKEILEQPDKSAINHSTMQSGNSQTEESRNSMWVVGHTTSRLSRGTWSAVQACCGVIQAIRAAPQVGLLFATNAISSTMAWGFLKDNYRLRNADVL